MTIVNVVNYGLTTNTSGYKGGRMLLKVETVFALNLIRKTYEFVFSSLMT